MKVLLVNTVELIGGAAKACYRLHKALLNEGIDSKIVVQVKSSSENRVLGPNDMEKAIGKIKSILDRLPLKKYKKKGALFSTFSINSVFSGYVIKKINKIECDIVHLHWFNDGFIRIEDLLKIKKPVVFSMHDMWLFTGGCHYNNDKNNNECEKYKTRCGECIALQSNKENDISRKVWERKRRVFSKMDMTVIGLSKWLTECAKSSFLLKDKKIVNIPNLIDTDLFKPLNKNEARKLFNLPENKKLILFSAMSIKNPQKGFNYLKEALNKIKGKDIELVVAGEDLEKDLDLGFKINYIGSLKDDVSLVSLYNAVDVTLHSSLRENLSNVIMESLSCGVPVVAFDIGGNSDMIEHKVNGYLAKAYEETDLARGVEWVLDNKEYDKLKENARRKIVDNFDRTIVVKKYIQLYEEILKNKKS